MRKFLFVVLFGMVAPAIADDQCPIGYTPTKYTQLEYIESTGTQYIDTGISAPNGFVVDITLLYNSGRYFFGSHDDSEPWGRNYLGFYTSSVVNFGAGGYMMTSVDSTQQIRIEASTKINDVWLKINGISQGVDLQETLANTRSANSLYLFSMHGHNSSNWSGKVHHCSITTNSTSVNFIPAKRNSDGEIGMYDTVTGHFFTNAGTGEFIAGPEILTENTCFPCPPNTYKDFVGNSDCTPCPDTFSSPSGAKSINECGRILHIGDYVAHMPVGRRTEHGLCTMFDGKKYCADMYERQ